MRGETGDTWFSHQVPLYQVPAAGDIMIRMGGESRFIRLCDAGKKNMEKNRGSDAFSQ